MVERVCVHCYALYGAVLTRAAHPRWRETVGHWLSLIRMNPITEAPLAEQFLRDTDNVPKFLLSSRAPASGGVLPEAVGTCKGSPLCSDRFAAPTAALTEPSSPLPCRKSHEAGALNKRNLGFRQCFRSWTPNRPPAGTEEHCNANSYRKQPCDHRQPGLRQPP